MPSEAFTRIIDMLKTLPDLKDQPIEIRRESLENNVKVFSILKGTSCEPLQVGNIPAEWVIAPEIKTDRVILYLHGGGYTMGSINTHRKLVSRISKAAEAQVLLIDYRLAPEHPFPAALEDSTFAYLWLLKEGFNPDKIVIAGDSAGGGLIIATLVKLRDDGEALPAAAVCLSPWTDLGCTGETLRTKADIDPMVRLEDLKLNAKEYLGKKDPKTPLASPIYADLSGLPPILIQVGTSEILLDDANRLAERAKDAGVDVALDPWEEMVHVWQLFSEFLPEGQEAINRIGDYIRLKIK
ncbi:MAG: alpha/beta hydrolase [Candidatus Helarchaeota archaeon]|nr:alpha/beta hydrolase [Candidatus Helarchaeota archaeon]